MIVQYKKSHWAKMQKIYETSRKMIIFYFFYWISISWVEKLKKKKKFIKF